MSLRLRVADAVAIAAALGAGYALKLHYSRASFDGLVWILEPTRRVVELMTGATFELEAGRAYLSRELLFEIVPSCAGVNFMIAAFCSLVCGLVSFQPTVRRKLGWLLTSAGSAYLLTILANATRIAIGIALHLRGADGLFAPEQLHRIEGIAVYFLFLCLAYGAARRLVGAKRETAPC